MSCPHILVPPGEDAQRKVTCFTRNEASSISDVGGSLSQLNQLSVTSNRCSDLMDFVHLVVTASSGFFFFLRYCEIRLQVVFCIYTAFIDTVLYLYFY